MKSPIFAFMPLLLSCSAAAATGAPETADWQWQGPAESAASLHTERSGNRVRFELDSPPTSD